MSDRTGPKVHELKCHPEPFAALKSGAKTFEWRKGDRGYQVGDTLRLMEWDPRWERVLIDAPNGYTGQELTRTVTYIIREGFGIPDGYCIMGLAAGAASKEAHTWDSAETLSNDPNVHSAMEAFANDPCGDNGVGAILAVLQASKEQADDLDSRLNNLTK